MLCEYSLEILESPEIVGFVSSVTFCNLPSPLRCLVSIHQGTCYAYDELKTTWMSLPLKKTFLLFFHFFFFLVLPPPFPPSFLLLVVGSSFLLSRSFYRGQFLTTFDHPQHEKVFEYNYWRARQGIYSDTMVYSYNGTIIRNPML